MKSFIFAILPALLAADASEDLPDWLNNATALATNFTIGILLPESVHPDPEEIGINASVALDEEKEYVNFEWSITKGMAFAEEMGWSLVPPPDEDADLPDGVESKDDLWDTLGLDGKESLTMKFRITKEHFSMAIVLTDAPEVPIFKDGKSLCVVETMDKMGQDAADAVNSMPGGFGVHDDEPHPHKDEEHVEKELKGVTEKGVKAGVKKDLKKGGGDEIDGDDTSSVDTDDMMDQIKGTVDEVPEDMEAPFTKTTGKPTNILLQGTEDGDLKGAKIWVNFTNLTTTGVPTSDEPVCKDGQTFDEAIGAMMPPPETQQRRLFEHAVKLRALETVNGALSVVRTLRPRTRAPVDTTQLWNSKDLEAAKMERYLVQRMHSERKMWRAAHAQYQRKSQMMFAGSCLLLAVMGLALFAAKCRRSRPMSSAFEPLARTGDGQIA